MRIGYARVSSRGQNLEAQIEILKKAGCEDIRIETGNGLYARPVLAALLQYMCKGDTLVVTRLDRLGRNARHLLQIVEQLTANDMYIIFVSNNIDTSTPIGKLLLTVLAGMAEFETSLRAERQAEGIKVAKARGKYKGRAGYIHPMSKVCIKLHGLGYSMYAIWKMIKVPPTTIKRILTKNNIATNRPKRTQNKHNI